MAWSGAALFAGSLLYFLFSYAITFRETVAGPLRIASVAANIGLFSAFAFHHSLFARSRVRALVAAFVSPALERSCYVWVASLMLIAVCALWQPLPGIVWQVPAPASWLLPVVQILGAWLALRSAAVIDIWDLAGVRQTEGRPSADADRRGQPSADADRRGQPSADADRRGRPSADADRRGRPSGRPEFEFKTTGPYGWVRHPIYLGWFLLVWPVPTMTMTRLVFAAASCVYVLVAIPFEERSLRRASGVAYDAYMQKVRWKLLPRLY